MGREFQGEAFKPTPAVVLFKDFEVGQSYRQVITLTNISLARNTFKASRPHQSPSSCDHNLAVPCSGAAYMAGRGQYSLPGVDRLPVLSPVPLTPYLFPVKTKICLFLLQPQTQASTWLAAASEQTA